MRAAVLDGHGGPEVLSIREIPTPEIAEGEILVKVVSSAVNRADLLQRMGLYPGPPVKHEVLGLEFAGYVCALGEGVTRWSLGDQVMGIVNGGAHAEKVSIHQDQAVRVPHGLTPSLAGALPEVFITAWDALVLQGALSVGQTALVHAGASGVGTAAIQVGCMVGAEVLVTVSGPKRRHCLDLGAVMAIDYQSDDWVGVVLEHTGGRGVDLVLDLVGGDYLDRNLEAVTIGGTIVQVGLLGGGVAQLTLGKLLTKRASIVGTVLRSRSVEEKVALSRAFESEVLPWFDDGRLRVIVDRRYSLSEISEAHRYMETNESVGKIALDVSN